MREAVDAIAIEVQRERSTDPARLDQQVSALRSVLSY
jgi:hypothetical protein